MSRKQSNQRTAERISARKLTLPPVADVMRRKTAAKSFNVFIGTYFSEHCPQWTPNQETLRKNIEVIIRKGGHGAFACPRGMGKTTLSRLAVLWAVANGIKKNIVVACSEKQTANQFIASIVNLTQTELFRDDYPEISVPLREIKERQVYNLFYDGEQINTVCKEGFVSFPKMKGWRTSGGAITGCCYKSSIRGITRPDLETGKPLRVDLIYCDDLQTDVVAGSPLKVNKVLDFIGRTLLPTTTGCGNASVILTGTVIKSRDVMEQILSDPLWNKMRLKAVSAFPDDLELWKEFYSVWAVNRKESFRFYADNKEQLEKGAKYEPVIFNQNNYPTALAFLMTEYLRKPAVFVSERQNDPSAFASGDASNYKIDERILHNCKIDKLPEQFDCISAGVDVHDDVLFYSVIGKQAETFYLLKIGVFPDQQIQEKSAMTPMSVFYPANPLTNSLNTLLDGLEKFSISGTAMPPKLILVDRGYRSDLIANIAAKRRTIFTCKGYAPSANQQPIAEWTRRSIVAKGSFYALNLNEIKNWYHIETPLVKEQLAAAINGGQFRIYEKCYCPALIEHFTCEVPEVREALYKRTVWTPQHNENHLWDTAVYALSAAMISEGSMIQDGIVQMKRQKINVNF